MMRMSKADTAPWSDVPAAGEPLHVLARAEAHEFPVPPARAASIGATAADNLYVLRGGRYIYTSGCRHMSLLSRCTASIGVAIEREPFDLTVRGLSRSYQALAIRPAVVRHLPANAAAIIGFQFDPEHADFPRFRAIPGPGVFALAREDFRPFDAVFRAAYRGELDAEEGARLFDEVVRIALTQLPKAKPVDGRAVRVIELLRADADVPTRALASAVGLSYYRLSHLFTENIGVTLRSFRQWCRLRRAMALFRFGYGLTRVAHEAGFTDASHLHRTFRQLYGAAPSHFFKNAGVRLLVQRHDFAPRAGLACGGALRHS